MIARIKDMAGKFTVTENGRQRPWNIRILYFASRQNTHAKAYADECATAYLYGLHVGRFLSAYEVSIAVSLLRIIDGGSGYTALGCDVISLFGFIPDDLAEIRLHTPKGDIYRAKPLCAAVINKPKNRVFLGQIDNWRMLAAMPADRLFTAFTKTRH